MKAFNLFQVLVILHGLMLQNEVAANPLVKREAKPNSNYDRGFHGGYVDNSSSENRVTVGVAGQKHKSDTTQYEQQILYGLAGAGEAISGTGIRNVRAEVGVHRSTSGVENIFNSGGRRDASHQTKFLSAGVEAGLGAMGRASLVEAEVNTGHVGFNMGVGVDTGAIVNDGLEVKFLGIGGKIGKDGIQGCFILCLGFNW